MDIALRVATRYYVKVAVTLPQSWFKERSKDLKQRLQKSLSSDVNDWPNIIDEKIIFFFDDFLNDFRKQVGFDSGPIAAQALESIKDRVDSIKRYIEAVAQKIPKDDRYVNFNDPVEYLRWYAINAIFSKMKASAKTIGYLFKYSWYIDEKMVDRLVAKTLKAATPSQMEALTDENQYHRKYAFLESINFEASALKALSRTKLELDFTNWVDRILVMLEANYSQKAVEESPAGFREFDLYGMKVVVDDTTVLPDDIKKYVRYLDAAFNKLKAKGFAKAWYGTVFIQCSECGGVNPNNGGGVGGHYVIGEDTVSIFSRPSSFIVELVVHELGHRYWFKQMRSSQRAKFESLVKTHTKPRPSKPMDVKLFRDQDLNEYKKQILQAQDRAEQSLARVVKYDLSNLTSIARDSVGKDGWGFGNDVIDAITSINVDKDLGAEVDRLKDDVYKTKAKLTEHFEDFSIVRPEGKDGWLSEARQLIGQLASEALIFIDFAAQKHNELAKYKLQNDPNTLEWMESYENNPAPVSPVSTYGASNIDEAFAEAFAHYVLEANMSRDQVESFRSVLKASVTQKDVDAEDAVTDGVEGEGGLTETDWKIDSGF